MPPSTAPHELAIVIGRFQPFHDGHLSVVRKALEVGTRVLVLIGSAFTARTPRHPFDWQERADAIRTALPAADRARVAFEPLRDHFDEARWLAEVRRAATQRLPPAGPGAAANSVALVGQLRDATRDYLEAFPEWTPYRLPEVPVRRASEMRDAWFAAPEAALHALSAEMPASSIALLRSWSSRPQFAELAREAELMRDYQATWKDAPYPPVLVTVDCIVKCSDHVLLITRGQAPGRGMLAVPGGFLDQRETTRQAALRELEEETHLDLPAATLRACLRASDVFDRPDRSQRGRTITHGHFFDLGQRPLPALRADDDALAAEWVPIAEVAAREDRFIDDHFQMLDHYLGLLDRPPL
ncbi:NUDIX domain-containing protein [Variovorax sp. J22P168]|uniref:NUDIX domain-containing protein n=1 Tax=Variovorax jilinensis TaxID=3053513 RepID=UPI002577CEA2|nr:NUDIX domain-containing protein [Variovorax sp. J22P168]MDM0012361.1 NUDIX domain-containing protein [Variovorax sp. J22P168]